MSKKKKKKREKKAEEQAQQEAKVPTSPETAKKRTETKKNCGKRELWSRKNLQQKHCKIEMNKMSGGKLVDVKKKDNQQSHHHPISFAKLKRKQNKVSVSKKAHGSKNSAAKKTA